MAGYIIAGVVLFIIFVIVFVSNIFASMVILPRVMDAEKYYKEMQEEEGFQGEFADKVRAAEQITIPSDFGYDLKGFCIEKNPQVTFADGKERVIILVHGYTACAYTMLRYADIFYEMGFWCVLYDHRHHGLSGEAYTTMGALEEKDLTKVCEWTRERFGENMILGTIGESMGAATVMLNAGENHMLSFVIEDCGYSTLRGQLKHNLTVQYHMPLQPFMAIAIILMKWRAKLKVKEVRPMDKIAQRDDIPALFVHGEKDSFVPTAMVYENYEAKKGPKDIYVCAGAEHAQSITKDKEEYRRRVHDFLLQYNIIER